MYVWEAWRNATGREMRSAVPLYKELSNQAARANGLSDMGELWLDRWTGGAVMVVIMTVVVVLMRVMVVIVWGL